MRELYRVTVYECRSLKTACRFAQRVNYIIHIITNKKGGFRSRLFQYYHKILRVHCYDCLVKLLLAAGLLRLVNLLAVLVNVLESKLALLELLTHTLVE